MVKPYPMVLVELQFCQIFIKDQIEKLTLSWKHLQVVTNQVSSKHDFWGGWGCIEESHKNKI